VCIFYQSVSTPIRSEKGDLSAESHNILKRQKSLLSATEVQAVNNVRQNKIHTAEPSQTEPSPFWGWDCCRKSEKIQLSSTDEIPVKMI
jgi:hypothetical protein